MVDNNLANEQPSPAADDVSVVTPYGDVLSSADNAALDAYFGNVDAEEVSASAPPQSAKAAPMEQAEGDEVVEEIDDESSAVEDDIDEDEDDSSPVEDDEIIFEYEDAQGKTHRLTDAELHNRLRRSDSASNKSREANALMEETKELKERYEAGITAQNAAAQQATLHPELQTLGMQAQHLAQVAQKALEEESLDYAIHDGRARQAAQAYHAKKAEFDNLQQIENANRAQVNRSKMREMGLGSLFDDKDAQTSFLTYITSDDEESTAAARTNAQIARWAEDSRLYQEMLKGQEKVKAKPAKQTRKVSGKRSKPAQKGSNTNTSAYEEGIASGQNGFISNEDSQFLDKYFS